MKNFTFKMPTRILFGADAALNLEQVLLSYGVHRAMIVTGPHVSETSAFQRLIEGLEGGKVTFRVFTDVEADPSIESVDAGGKILRESDVDGLVAVGGGSVIDTAKTMAMLATNDGSVRDYLFGGTKTVTGPVLPLIAIPTTAGSGSEVTASAVITDKQAGAKLSVTHDALIPRAAIIDPMMQFGMPYLVTASTGMDALTHAIEAYVSLNAELISDVFAEKAIRLISENLRTATYQPENVEVRSNMAIASTLAAAAFVNGGLGAVHGIAQAMGGIAHTPHGIANALLLPYVMELNVKGNPEKFARIAELMGENTRGLSLTDAADLAVKAVSRLVADLKLPAKLRDLKIPVQEEMFEAIVAGTMAYRLLAVNPVKVSEEDVYEILYKAL